MSATEYRILFMVRHEYFDTIVAGTKTFELRRNSPRWNNMAWKAMKGLNDGSPVTAVFTCGRQRVHRRSITGVDWWGDAERALGRPPTPEELAFLGDGNVVYFELGEAIGEVPK